MNIRIFAQPSLEHFSARLNSLPFRRFLLGVISVVWVGHTVFGQLMLSPTGVKETGLGTFPAASTALSNLINQSGIKVPFVSGATDFDTYFAPPNSNFSQNADGTKWQSDVSFDLPFGGAVDFDLGSTYLVDKVAIWNISVKSLTVMISIDTDGPWVDVGAFPLTDQQASLSLRATVLNLSAEHPARYVRLSIESEYPAQFNGTFGYVTIGEVVVRAAPVLVGGPSLTIVRELNGDIAITFTGTLQSKTNLNGEFIDVPGRPSGTYTVTGEAQLQASEQFFRSKN